MKTLANIFFILFFAFSTGSCSSSQNTENANSQEISNGEVIVYYFHYTRRCVTCTAVETVTKSQLEELYPEQMKNGKVSFVAIDIEKDSKNPNIEKYKAAGQTLLVTSGSKSENLTSIAFMNARSHPFRLKDALKKSIDPLLE